MINLDNNRFELTVLMFTLLTIVIFFFFKQKTAYEISESDWSSDVCSSDRSEEHTSELQSHSEISYAVFCLKKKTKQKISTYNPPAPARKLAPPPTVPKEPRAPSSGLLGLRPPPAAASAWTGLPFSAAFSPASRRAIVGVPGP